MFVFNLLFPIKCYQCGQPGTYLCPSCLAKISSLDFQKCPECGKLSPSGVLHPGCRNRLTKLNGLISLYSYSSLSGQIIRDFKYQPAKKIKSALIDLTLFGLRKQKSQALFWKENDYIFLPVPLFFTKKLNRGFNQTAEILGRVSKKLNLKYNDQLLIRKKWTKQQAKLDNSQRYKNVKSAFRLTDKQIVNNKNFVIFDDVWKTGSTIKSVAAVLKSAGANKIWALTICR